MKKKLYVSLSASLALTLAGLGTYKAYAPSDVNKTLWWSKTF